jgi:ribosomal protein S19E (S16A)
VSLQEALKKRRDVIKDDDDEDEDEDNHVEEEKRQKAEEANTAVKTETIPNPNPNPTPNKKITSQDILNAFQKLKNEVTAPIELQTQLDEPDLDNASTMLSYKHYAKQGLMKYYDESGNLKTTAPKLDQNEKKALNALGFINSSNNELAPAGIKYAAKQKLKIYLKENPSLADTTKILSDTKAKTLLGQAGFIGRGVLLDSGKTFINDIKAIQAFEKLAKSRLRSLTTDITIGQILKTKGYVSESSGQYTITTTGQAFLDRKNTKKILDALQNAKNTEREVTKPQEIENVVLSIGSDKATMLSYKHYAKKGLMKYYDENGNLKTTASLDPNEEKALKALGFINSENKLTLDGAKYIRDQKLKIAAIDAFKAIDPNTTDVPTTLLQNEDHKKILQEKGYISKTDNKITRTGQTFLERKKTSTPSQFGTKFTATLREQIIKGQGKG